MNTNRSRVITSLTGCAVAGVVGLGAMSAPAQAATSGSNGGSTKPAASGTPIGGPSTSGGVTTKHYADGNGGQVTVKTTASGEHARFDAQGNVLGKSDGWGAGAGSSNGSTKSSTSNGSSSGIDGVISQTKKNATTATELNLIKNGDVGKVLNTPAGSAVGKEAWGKAQTDAGVKLPSGVNNALTGYSMAKNTAEYVNQANAPLNQKDPAKILKSGGGAIADGASLLGAGPAAGLGKAAWNAGVDAGTKINQYTKDTHAVQNGQQRIADQINNPNPNKVVDTLQQTGNVLRMFGDVATGAYQRATGQDPATPQH